MTAAEHNSCLTSAKPASEWAEGYPIGNGRLGAMVLGIPLADRVALNCDLLWRRYWKGHPRPIASLFRRIQQLCLEEQWEQAMSLLKPYLPMQGKTVYVNPFVPAADIGIYPYHYGSQSVKNYRRSLDLDKAIAQVRYTVGDIDYCRQYLCSFAEPVIAIHLSASRAARVSGEITLFRAADRECDIAARGALDELTLEGCFEEGVQFAVVVKVFAAGGRLTRGIRDYQPPLGENIDKNRPDYLHQAAENTHWFRFRQEKYPIPPCGVSTCLDAVDWATILVAVATDRESDQPADLCRQRIAQATKEFDLLKAKHIQAYQPLYRRCSIMLAGGDDAEQTTDALLDRARQTGRVSPRLYELFFNMARYTAISAGAPTAQEPPKLPMNLQGIWNQDLRPAWDCDFHLDLNLQMCYWPLPMANLTELMYPLAQWAYDLLPQARRMAAETFGLPGAVYAMVADAQHLGNCDDLSVLNTGVSAWLAQLLWMAWEYSGDEALLRDRIYPILYQMGLFFEQFLIPDQRGRLVPAPSGSPEICPAGRSWEGMLSRPSAFDLELIRELFENLIGASETLSQHTDQIPRWRALLEKLPLPTLNAEGRLLEWLDEEYEVTDPGHRHRSHLVGICPGQRISAETTPEYIEGARKALEKRHSYGFAASCSLDRALDAQIFARLYQPKEAIEQIDQLIIRHSIDNLLMSLCVWADNLEGLNWFGRKKIFQLEASLGLLGALTELVIQDRGGLIRLLPALPDKWRSGALRGVRCRGGFVIDIEWKDQKLQTARIVSLWGGACRVKWFSQQCLAVYCHHRKIADGNGFIQFDTKPNEYYAITSP